jgi:hypothetical protein
MRRNWHKGQLRLGWAGHARGRGMAAGCRDNSRPAKSFLIVRRAIEKWCELNSRRGHVPLFEGSEFVIAARWPITDIGGPHGRRHVNWIAI